MSLKTPKEQHAKNVKEMEGLLKDLLELRGRIMRSGMRNDEDLLTFDVPGCLKFGLEAEKLLAQANYELHGFFNNYRYWWK